jgi:hypothetical protein
MYMYMCYNTIVLLLQDTNQANLTRPCQFHRQLPKLRRPIIKRQNKDMIRALKDRIRIWQIH